MDSPCKFNHIDMGACRLERIAGRSIHWVEAGKGPAVVLVHGSEAWSYAWRYQIEPLAAAGFRTIALDLPGSGYSDISVAGDYSISALSCLLGDLLDALKIQKAAFVASSAGGLPVLDFAIRSPERVSALVLASACGVPHNLPTPWRLMKVPMVGELMGLFINKSAVKANLREAFYDKTAVTSEMVSAYVGPVLRKGAWKTILKLERSWDPSFVEERVQCIEHPTLLIWGKNDPWHPVRMAHVFAQRIQRSQVEVLPDCGHLPHEEQPDIFNKLMIIFLSDKTGLHEKSHS